MFQNRIQIKLALTAVISLIIVFPQRFLSLGSYRPNCATLVWILKKIQIACKAKMYRWTQTLKFCKPTEKKTALGLAMIKVKRNRHVERTPRLFELLCVVFLMYSNDGSSNATGTFKAELKEAYRYCSKNGRGRRRRNWRTGKATERITWRRQLRWFLSDHTLGENFFWLTAWYSHKIGFSDVGDGYGGDEPDLASSSHIPSGQEIWNLNRKSNVFLVSHNKLQWQMQWI